MKLLFIAVVLLLACFSLHSTNANTDATTVKSASNMTVEQRIREELKNWENNWSGFPINCRRMVDTLSSDGVVEYPVGKNVISGGHRRIFSRCEAFIIENFAQMQTYITGPAHIVGYHAAFERTTLFMTKGNCRLYSRGIVTIQYDKDYKIKSLKDYFDLDELIQRYQDCQFPGTPLPDHMAGATDKPAAPAAPAAATATQDDKKPKDEL
ncbi:hypothetical protein SAMD00019534_060680 [Acytostelium subglobosum LB1]|uniref:hypothetical protein n=1 Tax=Acytostelium subglobosum LB1 TaxID=1410327 RepID=UPI0006452281|nr:hypothetical protein SAMD00019534_060680 [Acytostelium subglobosum LB1]GAM22893.1 hypothetical protein SAMD00019534_060680 [Acytostelium subglobosum LB1]|eukprot:XP_012754120.1 hypothetical protein SAMD00019534_060680 [Acytostelium subglobosum LB1]